MAKCIIIPRTFSIMTVGGSGEVSLGFLFGVVRFVVISATTQANARGRSVLVDNDNADRRISIDPEPGDPTSSLQHFHPSRDWPLNGNYSLRLENVNSDDTFDVYLVVELPARRVQP